MFDIAQKLALYHSRQKKKYIKPHTLLFIFINCKSKLTGIRSGYLALIFDDSFFLCSKTHIIHKNTKKKCKTSANLQQNLTRVRKGDREIALNLYTCGLKKAIFVKTPKLTTIIANKDW